jgi:hypothetical protein
MPALPPQSDFTGTTRTNAEMRATHAALHAFLVALLGDSGQPAQALAALRALGGTSGSRSASATLSADTDRGRVIRATGTITLTLPAAAGAGQGWTAIAVNSGSGTVTLAAETGEQIDGAGSTALAPGRAALVVSTGAEWLTLGLPGRGGGPLLATAGTAAAPGLAFAGDADTGLFRPGANAMGFAADGAERARVTAAGLQVTGTITGTAVTQSATDATAGRLLKVSDWGIGGNAVDPPSLDLDAVATGGLYRADLDTANRPTGTGNWLVQHIRRAVGDHVQLAISRIASAPALGLFYRRCQAGVWSAWQRLYTQDTVLGAVSQSGGVPTGAVIQRGTNANGEFVRLADGTQICTRRAEASLAIDTAFLGGFRSAAQTWTFPAAFAVPPDLSVTPVDLTAWGGLLTAAPTATGAQWAATAPASQVAATRILSLLAIGRWF